MENLNKQKVQIKPEFNGVLIYSDQYRGEIKCIGITIPKESKWMLHSVAGLNVPTTAVMDMLIKPLLHSVCNSIDIKDVDMSFVTTAQEAIDNGWFEDMESFVTTIIYDEVNGDGDGYSKVFEIVG